jgi:hypothetical protein
MPVGWDTPQHIYLARILITKGFDAFFSKSSGISFLYSVILAIPGAMNADLFSVRILFTLLLGLGLPVSLTWMVYTFTRSMTKSTLTMLFSAAFLSIYRLSADLHKTLLSLILFVVAFTLIETSVRLTRKVGLVTVLFLLMGLIQFEFAFFAGLVLLFYLGLLWHSGYAKEKTILFTLLFPLASLLVPLYLAFPNLNQVVPFSYPVSLTPPAIYSIESVLNYPLVFLPVLGCFLVTLAAFRRPSRFSLMLLSWFSLVVGTILMSYLVPTPFAKYAQRVFFLMPTPILCAIGAEGIVHRIGRPSEHSRFDINGIKVNHILSVSIVLLLLGPSLLFAYNQSMIHQRMFISMDSYYDLTWIQKTLNSSEMKIFVIHNQNAATSYMFDNWIGAVLGLHLRYYGTIGNLLALQPTLTTDPFDFSPLWLQEIKGSGIGTIDELFQHPIIVLSSFYDYGTEDVLPFANEIHPGVFLLNSSLVLQAIYLPRIFHVAHHYEQLNGPWYLSKENWTEESLKIYVSNPDKAANISVQVSFLFGGEYSISIKYFDTTSSHSPIKLYYADQKYELINYTGSMAPLQHPFNCTIDQGISTFTISLEDLSKPFYAIIDTLEITLLKKAD